MIVTTLNGMGAFAGAWEDWCDENYFTPENNRKCKDCNKKSFPLVGARCTYPDPKTTAGRIIRGLPLKTDKESGASMPSPGGGASAPLPGGIQVQIPGGPVIFTQPAPATDPAGGTSVPNGGGGGSSLGWLLGAGALLGGGLLLLRRKKRR